MRYKKRVMFLKMSKGIQRGQGTKVTFKGAQGIVCHLCRVVELRPKPGVHLEFEASNAGVQDLFVEVIKTLLKNRG
jgi:hypothetical protein